MDRELYKKNIDKNERQELRRQRLLQEQKQKRLEQQDEHRNLQCGTHKKPRRNSKYRHPTFQELYGDDISLQLSEWLREKPEDLGDWMVVPCPKGQRCLLVATRGRTKMFSKAGRFRMSFKSVLPGGGALENKGGSGLCVLDCIYNPCNDDFFVLDVLWYGKQCFLDCEAQFRFFWLKSRFEEEIDSVVAINCYEESNFKNFHLLSFCDLDNKVPTAQLFQTFPLWPENTPELDGFLFYHKEASYTCGPTPLVCWLFPFMVEEVLHMTVSTVYQQPSPNYTNAWVYMDMFDKELARKRQRRQTKQMDYENSIDSHTSSTSFSHMEKEMDGMENEERSERDGQQGEEEGSCIEHIMKAERLLELEGITEH